MAAIEKYCPDARNLLLIPENHTRNPQYYAERPAAGRHPAPDRPERALRHRSIRRSSPVAGAELPDGSSLLIEPLRRNGRRSDWPISIRARSC
jgi:glutamate--cysteine ligase